MSKLNRRKVLTVLAASAFGCGQKPSVSSLSTTEQKRPTLTPPPKILTAVPRQKIKSDRIPLIITMHGMESEASDFLGDQFQAIADDFQSAVLGVTAPLTIKRNLFAWSDQTDVNRDQVLRSITAFESTAGYRFSRRVILGYSQGAFAAMNLGLQFPDMARGFFAVSPGSLTDPPLAKESSSLKDKVFSLCFGSKDEPKWVRQGKQRIDAAKARGATVSVTEYPGQEHLIPDDVFEKLHDWIAKVDALKVADSA